MKSEFENIPLVKNESKKRFEIQVDGHAAFINYEENEHHIALVHTETDKELAGTGAAAAVVEKTLQNIQDSGKKILPFCPYVFAFIKKHPEWKPVVDEKFNDYDKL